MIPLFWYRWLFAVILGVMAFGIAMVLIPDAIRAFFSLLIYASPSAIATRFDQEANAYIVLAHGVLGAVMFGWGATLLLVLRGPFKRLDSDGWNMIAIPVAAWCVPDTAFSLYTGFWQNAVLNSVFAVLFLIPLLVTRKYFAGAAANASN
jgi:hypothetical protein